MAARKGFKFNLLPPKSDFEKELETERDDSLYAAIILLFVSLIAFFGLALAQQFFIEPRIEEANKRLQRLEQQRASFQEIKNDYGELVLKSKALSPLLDKSLNFKQIFSVSDQLLQSEYAKDVQSYSRRSGGAFAYEVKVVSLEDVPDFIAEIKNLDTVNNVFVENLSISEEDNTVSMSLSLNIIGA